MKDYNRLPTLLAVEPVSARVSTFPVKRFSAPILNSKQLSFFIAFSSFRIGLEDCNRGDSPTCELPFINYETVSISSQSSPFYRKYGCFNASAAVILSSGFLLSKDLSNDRVCWSKDWYYGAQNVMLLALFWARTSLQVLPGKALTPNSIIWKIRPKLNISHIGQYLVFMSLILMTSGATQPGVPHLTKRYSSALANYDRPKSAITHSVLPELRKMRFQGLRSRCIIALLCISFKPLSIEYMISFVS